MLCVLPFVKTGIFDSGILLKSSILSNETILIALLQYLKKCCC